METINILSFVLAVMGIMILCHFNVSKWNDEITTKKFYKDVKLVLTGIIISITFLAVAVGLLILSLQ